MSHRNPPAFDRLLIDQYETLERVVEPKWLPTPIIVGTAAQAEIERQHERIKRAHTYSTGSGLLKAIPNLAAVTRADAEQVIARLVKKKQRRLGFTEYGSGTYGTVYPTQTPGVVCKITSDASEAQFIANAISLNKWPHGIVRYYAVFKFKDRKYKKRPVFILWRDEVQPPTLADAAIKDHAAYKYAEVLHAAKCVAHELRVTIRRNEPSEERVIEALHLADHNDVPEQYLPNNYNTLESVQKTLLWIHGLNKRRASLDVKMAALFYVFRGGCETLKDGYGFNPGNALQYYVDNGMLLADVHSNNVMQKMGSDQEWVISDPGHMVELDNRFIDIQVPEI